MSYNRKISVRTLLRAILTALAHHGISPLFIIICLLCLVEFSAFCTWPKIEGICIRLATKKSMDMYAEHDSTSVEALQATQRTRRSTWNEHIRRACSETDAVEIRHSARGSDHFVLGATMRAIDMLGNEAVLFHLTRTLR